MKRLTRLDILNANDLPREEVDCPEWGGSVLVRGLTLGELSQLTSGGGSTIDLNTTALVACVIGDDGSPVFTKDDIEALKAKNSVPLMRLVQAINRLSGLTQEASDELKKPTEPEA